MTIRFFCVARSAGRLGELVYWTGKRWSSDDTKAHLMRLPTARATARTKADGSFHLPITEEQARARDDYVVVRRRSNFWVVLGNYTEWLYDEAATKPLAILAARRILSEGIGALRSENLPTGFYGATWGIQSRGLNVPEIAQEPTKLLQKPEEK